MFTQIYENLKSGSDAVALQFFSLTTLLLLVGLPLLAVVLFAVFPQLNMLSFNGAFSQWAINLGNPELLSAIKNSLVLGVSVVLFSIVIGVPLAYMRSALPPRSGAVWDLIALTPFLVPPYIGAASWIQLFQKNGFIEQIFGVNFAEYLFSFWGLVWVMTLHLYPIIYFATATAFKIAGNRYSDAAFCCGANKFHTFCRIQFPLALSAIASSSLIVFILTVEEFGTPEILGQRFDFDVIVTVIHEKFSDWPIDLPGASILSLVLIGIAFTFFALHLLIIKKFSVQTEASVVQARSNNSLIETMFYWLVFAVVALFSVVLPLMAIIARSFMGTVSGGLSLENISLINYAEIFSFNSDAWEALSTSLFLAVSASVLCVLIAIVSCFTIVRYKNRLTVILDFLAILPSAIPGMALAVGLILVWNQAFWPITPYNSIVILLLAYCCLMLPYPIRMIGSAMRQLPSSLDDAAHISGASEVNVAFRILFPIISPIAFASGFIVFAIASRELVTSVMLAPAGVETVAIFVFSQFDQGSINVGMAMSVVTIIVTGGLIIAAQRLAKFNRVDGI